MPEGIDPQSRLEPLVGRWRTEGTTRETAEGPSASIDAVDTYDWLPARVGLLHTVDACVGDERVEGAEIIGWEPARRTYITLYVGTDGPNSYEASLDVEDGVLTWRMGSATDRFAGRFSDDGETITGHWDRLNDRGEWEPWMDVTLTKSAT